MNIPPACGEQRLPFGSFLRTDTDDLWDGYAELTEEGDQVAVLMELAERFNEPLSVSEAYGLVREHGPRALAAAFPWLEE